MKYALFILSLLCTRVYAQLGAPDLRCLEVKTNGDVKLSWIAPPDPNSLFFAFEIYTANTIGGPYLPCGTVSAITTNTFVHAGAGANISSKYYYIVTLSGPTGASRSAPSDSLRSVFLVIQQISGAVDLKLIYYNLHAPPLLSTSKTYTINKEYPIGNWNFLGKSQLLNFPDTISVCSASINYQVELLDNSGCVSKSNVIGGVFKDTKDPDAPQVDSISVLPNGQSVLAWKTPYDKDVVKYEIQYKISTVTNNTLDLVNGRNTNSYTYTVAAASSSIVGLFVGAIDSCGRSSLFNYDVNTMLLTTQYNKCAYSTTLNWNEYKSMPGGVLEYRIYYSVNGGAFNLVGSTIVTSFVHNGVSPAKNICYFVRVINKNKTITSSSNRVCFFSQQVSAPAYLYISTATVRSNDITVIRLLCDTSKSFTSIELFRSKDSINFSSVGNLSYNGSLIYSFIDKSVKNSSQNYYYKAVLQDSCGNSRLSSNLIRTIFLSVQDDKEFMFTKHLYWSPYKGFDGHVKEYKIYRVINDVRETNPVGSSSRTALVFSDDLEQEAANGSKIEYEVDAIEDFNNTYGLQEISTSNRVQVYVEGRLYIPTALAPNGLNKTWLPITHFIDKNEYRVQIFNRWGILIFETRSNTEAWDGGTAPSDLYAYLITYKNSRGEYVEQKGSITLIR